MSKHLEQRNRVDLHSSVAALWNLPQKIHSLLENIPRDIQSLVQPPKRYTIWLHLPIPDPPPSSHLWTWGEITWHCISSSYFNSSRPAPPPIRALNRLAGSTWFWKSSYGTLVLESLQSICRASLLSILICNQSSRYVISKLLSCDVYSSGPCSNLLPRIPAVLKARSPGSLQGIVDGVLVIFFFY